MGRPLSNKRTHGWKSHRHVICVPLTNTRLWYPRRSSKRILWPSAQSKKQRSARRNVTDLSSRGKITGVARRSYQSPDTCPDVLSAHCLSRLAAHLLFFLRSLQPFLLLGTHAHSLSFSSASAPTISVGILIPSLRRSELSMQTRWVDIPTNAHARWTLDYWELTSWAVNAKRLC